MAHHKSAQKRIRQTVVRTEVNAARLSRVKTFIKKVEAAIASGDQAKAKDALREAQPEMMRGVSKGVLKQNTVSRKISRLAQRIKGLAA